MQAPATYVAAMISSDPAFDPLETARKRLLWRALHRGIKEMDILVGGYARRHVGAMTADELVQFAALLELPDQDLLRWATFVEPPPADMQSAMLQAILAFKPEVAV